MSVPHQPDLFGDTTAQLYADVVFDIPLDHAYTYAVPDDLLGQIGVGKRVIVPFGKGAKSATGYCVRLSDTAPDRMVKPIREVLDAEALVTEDLLRLTRWIADYYLCGWGQALNATIPGGTKSQAGLRAVPHLEAVGEAELPQPLPSLSPKQRLALEHLRASREPAEVRQLARRLKCGPGPIDALVTKGYARRTMRLVETQVSEMDAPTPVEPAVSLTEDQRRAWSHLAPMLQAGGFHCFLLHGVTGSGKTEVYLRAIEEVIKSGKQAIVLVPEISLTPQTIQRFQGRCGNVAVLHSHLGHAKRAAQWRQVARGEAHVVVGARSAVFAPVRELGLIVVDEEHEGSFKQEMTPRYHARDVAVMRARLADVPIILGSATPSLESWHNAQRAQYTLLSLPQRVMDLPLPHVALIDMRHESSRQQRFQAISQPLERAIRDALRQGGQVILLLNRRGFSTHVQCPSCGHVVQCRFCDLAMTFHRTREIVLCHYCGYHDQPPQSCPKCGKPTLRYQGLGTEKLHAEIESKFSGFVVRRMDSDSMKRAGSHARVLDAFKQGLIHILMGTQMIAKGLDFPNVTLVGVVNADVGLHIPDFRSAERTFQLLSQVSGRAGRGPRGGRVLIQTFNPEHPSVTCAAAHDYLAFVNSEMPHRREHVYPPFSRMVRIIVRGLKARTGEVFAQQIGDALTAGLERLQSPHRDAGVRILGPAEAPVFRLKNYYRYQIQLQSASSALLHELLRAVLPTLRSPAGVEYTIDVDPLSML